MSSDGDGDFRDGAGKSPDAFRTISEVADDLGLPQHVLRFWETRFPQVKPIKRGGGRRYYRPGDVELLRGVKQLLYGEGYTIRGVQRILREQGGRKLAQSAGVASAAPPAEAEAGPAFYAPQRVQRPDEIEPDEFRSGSELEEPVSSAGVERSDDSVSLVLDVPAPETALTEAQIRRLASALDELNACRRLLDGWS